MTCQYCNERAIQGLMVSAVFLRYCANELCQSRSSNVIGLLVKFGVQPPPWLRATDAIVYLPAWTSLSVAL